MRHEDVKCEDVETRRREDASLSRQLVLSLLPELRPLIDATMRARTAHDVLYVPWYLW